MSNSRLNEEVSVYAEVKPQLNSVHVVVSLPRSVVLDRKSNISVTAKIDYVEISVSNETYRFHMKGLKFDPLSCSGLRWHSGKEVHFRMKCQDIEIEILNAPQGKRPSTGILLSEFNVPNFTCACQACGHILLKNCRYKRVLPLPSEGWTDYADNWFCHKHEGENSTNQLNLNPSPQDCFVSDLYFVLHKMHIKQTCFTDNGKIQCRRCRHIVGQIYSLDKISTPDAVAIYKSFVHFGSSSSINTTTSSLMSQPRLNLEKGLFDFLLQQASAYRGYRLIVECRDHPTAKLVPFLLLWVLDSNSCVYEGHILSSEETVVITEPQTRLTILYNHCINSKNDSLLRQWSKDLSVHSVQMPQPLAHHFLAVLQSSTRSIPASLRAANDFLVGHLKKMGMTPKS